MHVFISFAPPDRAAAARLAADFDRLGHQVRVDPRGHGGQSWWDTVLRDVRECGAFVLAVSPNSLRSATCMAELRYAEALRRPVLPVLVAPAAHVPADLTRGAVDYTRPGAETAISLRKAFNALPVAKPCPPGSLPEPPRPPADGPVTEVDGPAAPLGDTEQVALLARLRARLADERERGAAWVEVVRLRQRADLTPEVADEVEQVLAPGWQPDPRGRFEARYWDGRDWTTLVWQNGHEFDDRHTPTVVFRPVSRPEEPTPEEAAAEAGTAELPVTPPQREPRSSGRSKGLPWLVAAGVLVLGGGAAGGAVLLGSGGPDPGAATHTARQFVDAVNTRDTAALRGNVCERDQATDRHLYGSFLDSANITLESVEAEGSNPRFTILAARTVGNSSVRLSIPLTEEDGEWRVCDISRALSGR